MAGDRPTAVELIETVRELLREKLLPGMSGHQAFEVRIAASLLAIALRELDRGPDLAEAERARLRDLLGTDAPLEELEAELVARLRSGALAVDDTELRAHLRATVDGRLDVANPKYRRTR